MSRALALFRELGDRIQQAHSHEDIGMIFDSEGNYFQALDHDRQALELFRAAGNQPGLANSLNAVGLDYAHLGDYPRALSHCQAALSLCRELALRHEEAAPPGTASATPITTWASNATLRPATASRSASALSSATPLARLTRSPTWAIPTTPTAAPRPPRAPGSRPWTSSTACTTQTPARSAPSLTAWRESRAAGSPKYLPRRPDRGSASEGRVLQLAAAERLVRAPAVHHACAAMSLSSFRSCRLRILPLGFLGTAPAMTTRLGVL